MTDAERSDEVRRAIEAWRPPGAPPGLLPSPGVGRGGRREGAGRKPVAGEVPPGRDRTPRMSVAPSPEMTAGLARAIDELDGVPPGTPCNASEAVRLLATAYLQDEAVRAAVLEWDRRRVAAHRAAELAKREGR